MGTTRWGASEPHFLEPGSPPMLRSPPHIAQPPSGGGGGESSWMSGVLIVVAIGKYILERLEGGDVRGIPKLPEPLQKNS